MRNRMGRSRSERSGSNTSTAVKVSDETNVQIAETQKILSEIGDVDFRGGKPSKGESIHTALDEYLHQLPPINNRTVERVQDQPVPNVVKVSGDTKRLIDRSAGYIQLLYGERIQANTPIYLGLTYYNATHDV